MNLSQVLSCTGNGKIFIQVIENGRVKTTRTHLDKLEYFQAIVECGSFQDAAIHLRISQPALTYAIKQLELHLGVTLIRRDHRQLALTAAGDTLAHFCGQLFPDLSRLEEHLRKDKPRQSVALGSFHSIATYLVPALSRIFAAEPYYSLKLVTGLSADLVADVVGGRLDLAIVVNPPIGRGLRNIEIYSDEFGFFTAVGHPAEVTEHAAIIFMPAAEDNEGRTLAHYIAELDLPFARRFEVDSFDVARELVAQGAGVGILPHRVAGRLGGGLEHWRLSPFPENRFGRHEFFLSVRTRSTLSAALVDRVANEAKSLMAGPTELVYKASPSVALRSE